jgi:cyclic pyranopterin phosphate synthase
MEFSHIDKRGQAKMVNISGKKVMLRQAVAVGFIRMAADTISKIRHNLLKKGDVLAVARTAAISGAKKTWDLIPLCHNIPINSIDVAFDFGTEQIDIRATAVCEAKTGIEMEVLTACAIAALTIYDMCKAVDKNMMIGDIRLEKKSKHDISS